MWVWVWGIGINIAGWRDVVKTDVSATLRVAEATGAGEDGSGSGGGRVSSGGGGGGGRSCRRGGDGGEVGAERE